MTTLDEAATLCHAALAAKKITAYAIVTVNAEGLVERQCYCETAYAELLGAVALLSKGTMDFYERNRPVTLTPVRYEVAI